MESVMTESFLPRVRGVLRIFAYCSLGLVRVEESIERAALFYLQAMK